MNDTEISVHPSNVDQLGSWDGNDGAYWAAHADHFDRCVADHHPRLMAAAAINPGERVLDIGCGAGRTTLDAARRAAHGSALGVDLSAAMLDVARQRADREGATNARFLQADAQVHPFDLGGFDAVISRTGAMFFGDQVAAFANLHRALRAGGRLVLLSWGPPGGNEWLTELTAALSGGRPIPAPAAGAPGPFALSEPDHVRQMLEAAGFTDVELEGAESPMWFGADSADADRFVSGLLGWMLEGLDDAARARSLASLAASTAAHQTDRGVLYVSTTWTIRARKP